jgi:hypothetical protein
LRLSQLEAWALSICDRISREVPLEDSRVELKAIWPDPAKAARRLAGHANAARGEPILWLIGVDEQRGAVGVVSGDTASWLSQIASHFDGIAPAAIDLVVPVADRQVVALLFDTTRAPFVVRNVSHGQPGGGAVEREVPWREGAAVRSARREDLIRLLVASQRTPLVETRGARCSVKRTKHREDFVFEWDLFVKLYLVPFTDDRIVYPFHRCQVALVEPVTDRTVFDIAPSLSVPTRRTSGFAGSTEESLSATMESTTSELIVFGPGAVELRNFPGTPLLDLTDLHRLRVDLHLLAIHSDVPIVHSVLLTRTSISEHSSAWQFAGVAPDT